MVMKEIHKLPLKNMDPALLTVAIMDSIQPYSYEARQAGQTPLLGSKKPIDEGLVFRAISTSAYLHRNQTRRNRLAMPITFYIEHPLRNAMRALRIDVTDPDVIIGIILHDVVEDCAAEICKIELGAPRAALMSAEEQREFALRWIKSQFGFSVARIVEKLSNPIVDQTGWNRQRKIEFYAECVRNEIMEDPEVFIGKFVDLMDNGNGLKHNDIPENRDIVYRLACKYMLLMDIFDEALKRDRHLIKAYVSERGLKVMQKQLAETRLNLQFIIDKHNAG